MYTLYTDRYNTPYHCTCASALNKTNSNTLGFSLTAPPPTISGRIIHFDPEFHQAGRISFNKESSEPYLEYLTEVLGILLFLFSV